MERTLLWGTVGVSLVTLLCGLLLAARRGQEGTNAPPLPRVWLGMALGLIVIAAFATLPSRPPFAAGQGLGIGFLLGGIGALGSLLIAARALRPSDGMDGGSGTRATAAMAAPGALAVLLTALPLLFLRSVMVDALMGLAIGWLVVTILLLLALSSGVQRQERLLLPLTAAFGFAATLCTLASLGETLNAVPFIAADKQVSWGALGLLLASGVPFLLLLSALPAALLGRLALKLPLVPLLLRLLQRPLDTDSSQQSAARGARLLLALVLLLLFSKLLAGRLLEPEPVLPAVVIGILIGLVPWWLTAEQTRRDASGEGSAWQTAGLAALTVTAGFLAIFQLWGSIGFGIALLAAWLVGGSALSGALEAEAVSAPDTAAFGQTASRLLRLLLFGVALLLYRLFTLRFDSDLRGAQLSDQYALFGLFSGVLLPALLAGLLLRSESVPLSPVRALLRLLCAGALTLAAPAALLTIWGPKCMLLLFFGLGLAIVLAEAAPSASRTNPGLPTEATLLLTALIALAVALALTQWTHHVLPMAALTRAHKIRLLAWAVGGLIALLLASDYGGRFLDRTRRSRAADGTKAVPQGGAQ